MSVQTAMPAVSLRAILVLIAVASLTVMLTLIVRESSPRPNAAIVPRPSTQALKIGLIPERDIFQQQRRYRALCDYLASKLDRPVEIVTSRTYEQILADLKTGEVDAAFLGSLVATLAVDRLDAQILVKPLLVGGHSTYHGVIFVMDSSNVRELNDLRSQSVAIVRTTTGGNLFLISEMARCGMFSQSENLPNLIWVGTHDDVIDEVVAGRANAGAVKNLRLDEYLIHHPDIHVRRLAESAEVPENALLVRREAPLDLQVRLRELLLAMSQDPNGTSVLAQFGVERFLPCSLDEYAAIYDLIDQLQGRWDLVGIPGPPPRRPQWQNTSPSEKRDATRGEP